MTVADDPGARIPEQLLDTLGQVSDRRGVGLLDEQIARLGVDKGKLDQLDSFVQVHQESRHIRVRDRDRVAGLYLVDEERDHAAAAAHHVAIARAADDGAAALGADARVRFDDMLHHGFAGTHRVDRVGCLVGRQADDSLNAGIHGGMEDVIRADDIRSDCFHREKLTARHLLEGRGVPDIADVIHRITDGVFVPHVADDELDFMGIVRVFRLQRVSQTVLFFLIPAEYPDFGHRACNKVAQDGAAERPRSSGDKQNLAFDLFVNIQHAVYSSLSKPICPASQPDCEYKFSCINSGYRNRGKRRRRCRFKISEIGFPAHA